MTIRTLEDNEIEQVAGGALATSYAVSNFTLEVAASSSGFTYKPPRLICKIGGGVGPISCMEVIPQGFVLR